MLVPRVKSAPKEMNANIPKTKKVLGKIYKKCVGRNWALNIGIENFPKIENFAIECKVSTKSYKNKYLVNYKSAWKFWEQNRKKLGDKYCASFQNLLWINLEFLWDL